MGTGLGGLIGALLEKDVRDEIEIQGGAVKGYKNIPLNELRDRLGELEEHKDKTIIAYCAVGLRGYIASRILKANGLRLRTLLEALSPTS